MNKEERNRGKKLAYMELRWKVRKEIKRTEAAFNAHTMNYNCTTDNSDCKDRRAFQERLATLNWVLKLLRVNKISWVDTTTLRDNGL